MLRRKAFTSCLLLSLALMAFVALSPRTRPQNLDSPKRTPAVSVPRWRNGVVTKAEAQVLDIGGKKFTLVILRNTADVTLPPVDDVASERVFEALIPSSTDWVFEDYRESLTAPHEVDNGREVEKIDEGYLDSLQAFDDLLENPKERMLLLEGEGLGGLLIGTLEYNHRSEESPFLGLEQAKRMVLKRDPVRLGKIKVMKRNGKLSEKEELVADGLEVNKMVAHPKYRGTSFVTPLLWTAAILNGIFDHGVPRRISKKALKRLGKKNTYYREGYFWYADTGVFANRLEIRPHIGMVPFFEALGFKKIPASRMRKMKVQEYSKAAQYAEANQMDLNDVVMSIPRSKWLKIPAKLVELRKAGALAYLEATKEYKKSHWLEEQLALMGLPPEEREHELKAPEKLSARIDELIHRAAKYQAGLPEKERHWAFKKDRIKSP